MAYMARTADEGGHRRAVLDRLAKQACQIMSVERAVVFVRDRRDPLASVVIAGHGVPDDLIGRRFGIDEGIAGQVLRSGRPVLVADYEELAVPIRHEATEGLRAAGSAPIRWGGAVRGALSAGTTDPLRRLGAHELELLCELADLGAVALEHAEMREQLERSLEAGVSVLASAVDIRDSYTARHSERVVELARRVGEQLGLERPDLDELRFAAGLHDIGKLGIPDAILKKPGPLTSDEWEVMRRHPVSGAEMLHRIPGLEGVAIIVLHHHERFDGRGYPDGLRAEQITLASRIVAACDAYQAMVTDRPYRPALDRDAAERELRAGAGLQFDPSVVAAVIDVIRGSPELAESAL